MELEHSRALSELEGRLRFNENSRSWLRSAPRSHPLAHLVRELTAGIVRGIRELRLHEGARLLDFGCADQPYRNLLPSGVEYLGADLAGNPLADVVVGDDGRLPVDDGSFDAILSTQVLEHVADPALYVRECFRVLRPGGRLLLTTHGTMVLHPDPIDYWRWTSDGLRHEVRRAGFEVGDFFGIMGLAATAVQLFQDATLGSLPRALRRPYATVMQAFAALCDRFQSERSRSFNAFVYAVLAEKPAAQGAA